MRRPIFVKSCSLLCRFNCVFNAFASIFYHPVIRTDTTATETATNCQFVFNALLFKISCLPQQVHTTRQFLCILIYRNLGSVIYRLHQYGHYLLSRQLIIPLVGSFRVFRTNFSIYSCALCYMSRNLTPLILAISAISSLKSII